MYHVLLSQKLSVRIFRHLLLFFTMVLLFAWVTYSRSVGPGGFWEGFLMVFTNALFFFGYAYITVYLWIVKLLLKRRILVFIIAFVLTGLALSLLKFLFSDYIFYQAIAPENPIPGSTLTFRSLLVNTKDMTFIVAVFALVKFARDHYSLKLNNRELQKKALEAELRLIEHQMDPHVIFNNLNNLYSISIYRPELLQVTVKKLKSILHYLFKESKSDKVMLVKEVDMIQNYIGLETLRFGDRLNVSFHTEGSLHGLMITPLILYSFVEYCFVHGADENPMRSSISIELKVQDSRLRFMAVNSVNRSGKSALLGHSGSDNSIRRLELAYPNRHRLAIREKEDQHEVELHISL